MFKTRAIKVGKLTLGGGAPIRIQSMTTSNTRDAEATVAQIIRLADSGCDIVRVTVQGMKEAEACAIIKNSLLQKGYEIPLVADIHFYPPAALKAVECVDKVRINPGNFADKRAIFKQIDYDAATYAQELLKLEEKFLPLVEKCSSLKKALRIGVNHGSLSDRIMNRYGDTPAGMVESALEFARLCRKKGFHDFCFSMKSSNPVVMVAAYRLLVAEMEKLGWDYPLHLGVTEAGLGQEGRIKSAVGIGALLLDGIGDTIRVSLTEDPWEEIAPCKQLIAFYEEQRKGPAHPPVSWPIDKKSILPPLHRDGSVFLEEETEPFTLVHADDDWEKVAEAAVIVFVFKEFPLYEGRKFCAFLKAKGWKIPVLWFFKKEPFVIQIAAACGALLLDQLGQGVVLASNRELGFSILQACRMRATKTDFISCPGCGRTLFGLQEVTRRIQSRTAHLPGVKIAIMGCIVNGPGEMADADFGYVGSKPGKIDLYVGKQCVQKEVDFSEADDKLIELIKSEGKWID